MRWSSLKLVATLELRSARRSRWLRATAATWLFLGVVLAWSATPPHLAFWSGWERTALSLLPVLLLFLPLTAILLTVHTTTGDPGALELMSAQPVEPRELFGGKLLTAWLLACLGWLGGVAGAAVVAFGRGAGGSPLPLLLVAGAGLLLAASLVAVGGWIAAGSCGRLAALGGAIGVWAALVFVYDFILIGVAALLAGPAASLALAALLVLNPIDAARLAALAGVGLYEGLGPTGLVLGRAGTLGVVAPWLVPVLWSGLFLALAMRRWRNREGFGDI